MTVNLRRRILFMLEMFVVRENGIFSDGSDDRDRLRLQD